MIQLWRVITTGTRNFSRNLWLSMAATAVMTVTLTIVLVSFIANSALTSTIKGVTNKIDVSVYLIDTVTTDQLMTFENQLKADSNVVAVKYVSKADALAAYKQSNANNQKLLQAISEADNPLPASLEIKTKDPKNLTSVSAIIAQPANAALQSDPPSYSGSNKVTIDRIVHAADFFKTGGTYASLLFVVISILIIFNTIRMAIFTRRDEIEIMKLVGATKWFIRGPFLVEAAMYGVIAAIIALVLAYTLVLGAAPKLGSYIDVTSTIHTFKSYPLIVIGGELIIGIAIGCFSSLLAMSRYLKL
jgi:cell division transport system permease protein